jgi:hypothetical protein
MINIEPKVTVKDDRRVTLSLRNPTNGAAIDIDFEPWESALVEAVQDGEYKIVSGSHPNAFANVLAQFFGLSSTFPPDREE